ncbi:MAG: PIN domain-containing protein [Candidatus Micrarchaeota archaeon]
MLFDTFAWIEFFNGTTLGRKVTDLLKHESPATAMPTLSELASWALKNGYDPGEILSKVAQASNILGFNAAVAQLAGELHYKYKKADSSFGMVDSMIYATALSYGLKLVTGDPHFKDKPEVVFL